MLDVRQPSEYASANQYILIPALSRYRTITILIVSTKSQLTGINRDQIDLHSSSKFPSSLHKYTEKMPCNMFSTFFYNEIMGKAEIYRNLAKPQLPNLIKLIHLLIKTIISQIFKEKDGIRFFLTWISM